MLKTGKIPLLLCSLLAAACFGNSAWITLKAELAQLLIERAWSETLNTGRPAAPWEWADFWPVARIMDKKSGRALFVLSSASGQSLAFGPGHVNGSPFPATSGTSIIAGHRDTHFKFLKSIKTGDLFSVQRTDGYTGDYRVMAMQVVDSRYAKLRIETGQPRLKFVTCYPFDAVLPGGPGRLVVELQAVEAEKKA